MRSDQAFQTFGQVRRVVLDKTGTLTAGKPSVAAVLPAEGIDRSHLLRLAGAAEVPSEHPLARAVVDHALQAELDVPDATDFHSLGGNGVEATVKGHAVVVGRPGYVAERLADAAPEGFGAEAEEAAQTVVWAAADGQFLGAIGITDAIRPDADDTVAALGKRGMGAYLVTGDNERVARAVAARVGISEVRAGVLPDQKADIVRELQSNGTRVAMVGDGINDAPALMQADVGIAIGAGIDIAIESADIILIGERVSAVADAYDVATESYRKTKQNLLVALALNSIGVPAAASGHVNPIWAMVAMVTSVTVVLSNSFGTNLPLTLWKGVKTLLLPELSDRHGSEAGGPEVATATEGGDQVAGGQPTASPIEAVCTTYRVGRVHGGSCAKRIEEGVGSLPGVEPVLAGSDAKVVVEGAVPQAAVTETMAASSFPVEHVVGAPTEDGDIDRRPPRDATTTAAQREETLKTEAHTKTSPPWSEEPGHDRAPSRWSRYRAWIQAAAIVVVVMGIGVWDVVANGPIHPHV